MEALKDHGYGARRSCWKRMKPLGVTDVLAERRSREVVCCMSAQAPKYMLSSSLGSKYRYQVDLLWFANSVKIYRTWPGQT